MSFALIARVPPGVTVVEGVTPFEAIETVPVGLDKVTVKFGAVYAVFASR